MKHTLLNIKKFINQPFPEDSSWASYARTCFFIGVFIALFLYYFRPFGLAHSDMYAPMVCFIFGMITCLMSLAYRWVLLFVGFDIHAKTWVLWRWTLSTMLLVLLIGLSNYFFLCFLNKDFLNLPLALGIVFNTVLLGLFPVFFLGALKVNRNLVIHRALSQNIKPIQKKTTSDLLIFNAQRERVLDVRSEFFYYAEAKQNYIEIVYNEDGHLRQLTMRSTLASLTDQIANDHIVRCHRSYVVNLDHVIEIGGNAQGLKLFLNKIDDYIPVSRTYISTIQQKMA